MPQPYGRALGWSLGSEGPAQWLCPRVPIVVGCLQKWKQPRAHSSGLSHCSATEATGARVDGPAEPLLSAQPPGPWSTSAFPGRSSVLTLGNGSAPQELIAGLLVSMLPRVSHVHLFSPCSGSRGELSQTWLLPLGSQSLPWGPLLGRIPYPFVRHSWLPRARLIPRSCQEAEAGAGQGHRNLGRTCGPGGRGGRGCSWTPALPSLSSLPLPQL